jgi:cytochrome c biogenesis protein CcdA
MSPYVVAATTALWLGLLCSISPCPLATNVAAMSYIAQRAGNGRRMLLSGLLYTVGRSIVYVALGVTLVASLLSVPQIAYVLQREMNALLGPLLILIGMVLLDLLSVPLPSGGGLGDWLRRAADRAGLLGAFLLGAVFALTFCPISAALYFGSLIPLSIQQREPFLLPALFGLGTALPVVLFAALIALGARSLSTVFNRVGRFEKYGRLATGLLFVALGIYFTLKYIYRIV